MHMLLAAFLTTTMCVIAAGASYLLRGIHRDEALVMMHWGMGLAAVLIVVQLFFGHLNGKYVYTHQPTKFAAIEARWQRQQPGTEVWFAIPDEVKRRNLFAIESPGVGSFIATGTWTAPVYGLSDYPEADWPPVVIPFFTFRIMVGMGLVMLAISWFGNWLRWRGRLDATRWFLWCASLAFPAGFVAVLSGWYTAEVGRQPWVVWGLLRTVDAITPTLTGAQVLATLIGYVVVYTVIFAFGMRYIYVLVREGPISTETKLTGATAMRPMAAAGSAETATGGQVLTGG
jgi:cytochrome d ubiquinol oxidase subunit I